jgi:small-conductance mechanosensitive channel
MKTRIPKVVVASAALGVVLSIAGAASAQDVDAPDITKLAGVIRWSGIAISFFVIVGAMVTIRFVTSAADRLGEQFTNRRPTIQLIESITRFVIYFVAGALCIVLSFRIDQEVLKFVGGGLAVAVGFALRDLVAAIIAGLMIMFDRPFQVGDRVEYAGEYGDIVQIGLRSVRMVTLDDNVVTIPNNKVLTDVTSSGNYGSLDMQVGMDFYVGVDQDAELAERLVRESMLTSQYVFLDKPVVVLVTQVLKEEYVAIKLRAKGYVLDTKYEKAFETDVNKRVLRAFRKHGIAPPAMLYRALPEAQAS